MFTKFGRSYDRINLNMHLRVWLYLPNGETFPLQWHMVLKQHRYARFISSSEGGMGLWAVSPRY